MEIRCQSKTDRLDVFDKHDSGKFYQKELLTPCLFPRDGSMSAAWQEKSAGKKGLVSVIMPAYNRAYIIKRAIASVLQQSYGNFELIIVDDGSDDNTEEVVRSQVDRRIRYIGYAPNRGGNHARNVGMGEAVGEYLAFLDTDNTWHRDFLEQHVTALEKFSADLTFCRYEVKKPDRGMEYHPSEGKLDTNQGVRLLNPRQLCIDMLCGNMMDTNTVCIRRKSMEKLGGFDEKLRRLQDWEFFLRIVLSGKCRIAFIPTAMAHGEVLSDSITHKVSYFDAHEYILRHYLRYFREYGQVIRNVMFMLLMGTREHMECQVAADRLRGVLTEDEVQTGIKAYERKLADDAKWRIAENAKKNADEKPVDKFVPKHAIEGEINTIETTSSLMKNLSRQSQRQRALILQKDWQEAWRRQVVKKLLRSGDILLADNHALCGQIIAGMPVCVIEALTCLTPRPIVIVPCAEQGMGQKLQGWGYEEEKDFVFWQRMG